MVYFLISELLIALICFLGLFVGLLVGFLAKGELKDGRKYFIILEKVLFILIVFFVFYEFGLLLLGLLFVVFFSIILFSLKKDYHKLLYFVSAVFLFISFFSKSITVPSLIFFFGFPIGSLYLTTSEEESLIKGIIVEYWYFLLIVVVLSLVKLIL